MKPKVLQRGATLKEITSFSQGFENSIIKGYLNAIPRDAIHSQLLIIVDESWMTKRSDLNSVLNMMDKEAAARYALHTCWVEL